MTAPPVQSLIEVGRVARAHGVRGELRVVLHWELSDALARGAEVVLEARGRTLGTFEIRSARRADRAVLLSLAGVEDRDAAERLRGATVSVSRARLSPLGDGEYYLCDLVGAEVIGPDGAVGEVIEVRVHPSVDTLVVRTPNGKVVEQPIVEPWIASVDAAEKRVVLASIDGLVGE